jgi:FAD:protein FMN transferase
MEPVLGTRFTLQVRCTSQRVAQAVFVQLQAEIDRLENIFSVYRPQSTLSQWKRSASSSTLTPNVDPELCEVFALAETWRAKTAGCFTPLADEFTKTWREAEAKQLVPSDEALDTLCRALIEPRYVVNPNNGAVTKTGDCSALSLHAVAKGWIVDRAAELAIQDERVLAVLVNIGGDLRLCGTDPSARSTIAIENPLRAYDNEPPICRVEFTSGGLATSGGSRRGFSIDGKWYSHVIDPRTGHPVNRVASATVYAPDAATADVIATMLSVVEPVEGLAFLESLTDQASSNHRRTDQARFVPGSLGCLIVDPEGNRFSNDSWKALTT